MSSKPEPKKDIETFYATGRDEWRQWLLDNHDKKQAVWLLQYKKTSGKPSLTWTEAVEEALCFGWIDSIRKSINGESFVQYFGPRKPTSAWSKINKAHIERLIANGQMHEAGLATIATAKQNGTWTILDAVEELTIPKDLTKAFKAHKGAKQYFESLSKSVKKMMLHWIATAKRPETREKRINELAGLAGQKQRPKQFM